MEKIQYIAFSPKPDFIDSKWSSHYAQYDPAQANALLDQTGAVDRDGDGMRELPNGDPLVINIDFATQGIGGGEVELVARHWNDVGVKTLFKEVTPDEYRSAQSSNQLDVGAWQKNQPIAIILGESELFVPPYENYFGHTNAILWAEYIDSSGSSGIKPPQYAYDLIDAVNTFQSASAGSAESHASGNKMVELLVENLLFIGTVAAPYPVFVRNALKNVTQFKVASYNYYRTFPYLPQQWYLAD